MPEAYEDAAEIGGESCSRWFWRWPLECLRRNPFGRSVSPASPPILLEGTIVTMNATSCGRQGDRR